MNITKPRDTVDDREFRRSGVCLPELLARLGCWDIRSLHNRSEIDRSPKVQPVDLMREQREVGVMKCPKQEEVKRKEEVISITRHQA